MSVKAYYDFLLGGTLVWTALFITSALSRRGVLATLGLGIVYFSWALIALFIMLMNGEI